MLFVYSWIYLHSEKMTKHRNGEMHCKWQTSGKNEMKQEMKKSKQKQSENGENGWRGKKHNCRQKSSQNEIKICIRMWQNQWQCMCINYKRHKQSCNICALNHLEKKRKAKLSVGCGSM